METGEQRVMRKIRAHIDERGLPEPHEDDWRGFGPEVARLLLEGLTEAECFIYMSLREEVDPTIDEDVAITGMRRLLDLAVTRKR